MAAITTLAITELRRFSVGDRTGKQQLTRADFAIVLAAQGATAGDIPKALLGFSDIYTVRIYRVVATGEKMIAVGTDGTDIYTFTAVAGATAPANFTGTIYISVEGRAL